MYTLIDTDNEPLYKIVSSDDINYVASMMMSKLIDIINALTRLNVNRFELGDNLYIVKSSSKDSIELVEDILYFNIDDGILIGQCQMHNISKLYAYKQFIQKMNDMNNSSNKNGTHIKQLINNKISTENNSEDISSRVVKKIKRNDNIVVVDESDSDTSEDSEMDSIVLKNKMEELMKIKKDEEQKAKLIEQKLLDKQKTHDDIINNINDVKIREKRERDREEEREHIFESDINVYHMIKKDIAQGIKDDIPILFKDKYPIFDEMCKNGDLDKDDAYDIFKRRYYDTQSTDTKIKGTYKPHNYEYLSETEKKMYQDVNHVTDSIETKMTNPVKPLDEILNNISSDSSSDDE